MKEVSKVGIFYKGKYLMGVRQDTGKWTEPGGHLHAKEDPLKGALREVKEETGITLPPDSVKPLGDKEIKTPDGTDLIIHAFRADLKTEPNTSVAGDPDKEVFGWDWIPVKGNKLPESVNKNLHVPAARNALHFFLGFEKKASMRKIVGMIPSPQTIDLIMRGRSKENRDSRNKKRRKTS